MHRYADIQGLRALAVLAVILFHAGLPVPGGFVGVDMFFVISGFVIANMLIRERQKTGRIELRSFYVRRFKRLTPALAVVVVFSVAGAALLLSPLGSLQNATLTGIGALLISANYVIAGTTGGYFAPAADINPLLHTWSLSVEEQFYLGFPMLLMCGWWLSGRGRASRGFPVAILVAVGLASALLAFAAVVADPVGRVPPIAGGVTGRIPTFIVGTSFGFYGPLGRVWEFIAGALVAFALTRIERLPSASAKVFGVAGAAGILGSMWLISEADAFPGPWTVLPVVSTVLLITAGRVGSNVMSRVLAARPAVWIGDRSYSWYLWHWPLIVFADLLTGQDPRARVVALAVSLGAAMASYRWIENPLRAFPSRPLRRFIPVAAAILVVPLVLSAGTFAAARDGFANDGVRAYQAADSAHLGEASGCDTTLPLGMRDEGTCTWNGTAEGAPIYLVGDSNADHFSEAVLGAALALDAPLHLSTSTACPLFAGFFYRNDMSSAWNARCDEYRTGTIDFLLADATPGTVIISQVGIYWSSSSIRAGLSERDASTETSRKLHSLEGSLGAMVENLRAAGHKVLLVQEIPFYNYVDYQEYQPQLCSSFAMASFNCVGEIDLTTAEDQFQEVQRIYDHLGSSRAVDTLQLRDELCDVESCTTIKGGTIMYRDGTHLSVDASKRLSGRFEVALRDLRTANG
ncbi:acyltransferase family protein [Leifsonia sp. Leaf264]|uniref:acyltransferase family protein n=1 Tax=Leifsonia sp. Leaf264 TaxID=1736314 RepID=UPI0006FEF738|nr:acyltransferase family protein [Leifsonia sp. Leaf264]KQO95410.1 hypothetical protein ASF30_20550 [Leifsonia sp. Leaf264]